MFHAVRYEIPIENIEPPTAALEYARRMAQRGVPMNALVRAYRLGHEIVLEFARDEIADAGMDPRMSLAVFERVTAVTFRYVDWISQEVVVEYEQERDRWLENRNSERAMRVREVLIATEVDLDAITYGDPISNAQNPSRCRPLCCPRRRHPATNLPASNGFSGNSPNRYRRRGVHCLSLRTG